MIKYKNEEYDEVVEGKLKVGDIVKTTTPKGSRIFEITKATKITGFAKITEDVVQKFTATIDEHFKKVPQIKDESDITYKIYRKV
jgi:uncharacterized protein YjaG (DUF416 family)